MGQFGALGKVKQIESAAAGVGGAGEVLTSGTQGGAITAAVDGAAAQAAKGGGKGVRNTTPPALKDSPYSPQNVSKRQSQTRRDMGLNADPDTPIPAQGPGGNIKSTHSSAGKQAHRPGQRNVAGKGMEEHNIKPPGRGGRGPGRR